MIIKAQSPLRISLFGGGTDLDPYMSQYGSLIVSFAVNLRQYITLYTDEDIYSWPLNTYPPQATPGFLEKIIDIYAIRSKVRIQSECDGHLKAGLGSSAAAAVSLIGAFLKYKNKSYTNIELATQAWEIEELMGWHSGRQDQLASVYGGFNRIEITKEFTKITPMTRDYIEPLVKSMVLFYLGERKNSNLQDKLLNPDRSQITNLNLIKQAAVDSLSLIQAGDYIGIGELLDTTWKLKKSLNPNITTPAVDEFYQKALVAGAIGGKLLGAGGGGYMFFIVRPRQKDKFLKKLQVKDVDFSIDWQGLSVRKL